MDENQIQNHIEAAKTGFENTKQHLLKSVADATITGIHLLILKNKLEDINRVPRGTRLITGKFGEKGSGFKGALTEINIPTRTAYRWMNASANTLSQIQGKEDYHISELPPLNTPEWRQLEETIIKITEKTTLSRLSLGACAEGDINRLETIQTNAENGNTLAAQYLEKIEIGEMTLVQAIRALAGADATKDQPRAEIIYCDIDSKSGKLTGLAPRALVSLNNAIQNYPTWPPAAQKAFRNEWKTFINSLPAGI